MKCLQIDGDGFSAHVTFNRQDLAVIAWPDDMKWMTRKKITLLGAKRWATSEGHTWVELNEETPR